MSERYPVETLGGGDDDGTMVESLEALRKAVVGKRIVTVEGTRITLDDGHQVDLVGQSDCCAYTELESFLLHPELVDHAITGIGTTGEYTTWHIFADAGDVLELSVGWSCGNPFFYGYGFDIKVAPVSDDRRGTDA